MLEILPIDIVKYILELIPQYALIPILLVNKKYNKLVNEIIDTPYAKYSASTSHNNMYKTFNMMCKDGDVLTIIRYYKNSSIFYKSLNFLSIYGNKEAVEFILKILFKSNISDEYRNLLLTEGLSGACARGHIDIIELMLLYIPIKFNEVFTVISPSNAKFVKVNNDLNLGLYNACKWGHLEAVKLMIKLGANELYSCLIEACKNCPNNYDGFNNNLNYKKDFKYQTGEKKIEEYLEIIKLLIDNGASNLNSSLYYSCNNGNLLLSKLLISLGAAGSNCDNCAGKYH